MGFCSVAATVCSAASDCPGMNETCDKPTCAFHNDCQMPDQTADLGECAPEVRNTGELWTETLWLARTNLVARCGFDTSLRTANQLVVAGMKLSVPDPTFLDDRNAILQADLLDEFFCQPKVCSNDASLTCSDANIAADCGDANATCGFVARGTLSDCKEPVTDTDLGLCLPDPANTSGANQCLLWDAFAKMGLGLSA